ncbi:T-cell leukemia/lymphoma protein 1A-like [Meriones unguiculatus]|uniref:T-cell leukemia/lymphoma protein 1A-like n=1 Tax=Meriones unguiculatus TaxID=10047 RepID=UPI00293E9745|nr:T-cell leukemia/lymphoma protein 1A-like [Meriones unguiculatus]
MAQQHRPERPRNPDRLWIWEKDVYVDEFRRSWLPTIKKNHDRLQVIFRQEDVPLGTGNTPKLKNYKLPLLYQLYPGDRYRSSDSWFWKIVYHVKYKGVEDMLLEKMYSDDE